MRSIGCSVVAMSGTIARYSVMAANARRNTPSVMSTMVRLFHRNAHISRRQRRTASTPMATTTANAASTDRLETGMVRLMPMSPATKPTLSSPSGLEKA